MLTLNVQCHISQISQCLNTLPFSRISFLIYSGFGIEVSKPTSLLESAKKNTQEIESSQPRKINLFVLYGTCKLIELLTLRCYTVN